MIVIAFYSSLLLVSLSSVIAVPAGEEGEGVRYPVGEGGGVSVNFVGDDGVCFGGRKGLWCFCGVVVFGKKGRWSEHGL